MENTVYSIRVVKIDHDEEMREEKKELCDAACTLTNSDGGKAGQNSDNLQPCIVIQGLDLLC